MRIRIPSKRVGIIATRPRTIETGIEKLPANPDASEQQRASFVRAFRDDFEVEELRIDKVNLEAK
jgi:hypothetical protein